MQFELDTATETNQSFQTIDGLTKGQSLSFFYLDEATLAYVGGGEVTNDY